MLSGCGSYMRKWLAASASSTCAADDLNLDGLEKQFSGYGTIHLDVKVPERLRPWDLGPEAESIWGPGAWWRSRPARSSCTPGPRSSSITRTCGARRASGSTVRRLWGYLVLSGRNLRDVFMPLARAAWWTPLEVERRAGGSDAPTQHFPRREPEPDGNGQNALHHAVARGDAASVQAILDRGYFDRFYVKNHALVRSTTRGEKKGQEYCWLASPPRMAGGGRQADQWLRHRGPRLVAAIQELFSCILTHVVRHAPDLANVLQQAALKEVANCHLRSVLYIPYITSST